MTKPSARAKAAVKILAEGGRFAEILERNPYTGREQFQKRLLRRGRVVKGYSFKVFYELKTADLLQYCENEGTIVSSYWKLAADRPAP